jgi:subtilisin family serine protease
MVARQRSMLLRLSGLSETVSRTSGNRRVVIAMIDGPPEKNHSCLDRAAIASVTLTSHSAEVTAAAHATFIASMLVGGGEPALGLCQNCRLLAIAALDAPLLSGRISIAVVAERLARAVTVALQGGADVILLPLDVASEPNGAWGPLIRALGEAARLGVRTVISAGNRSGPAAPILAISGVVPVAGCEGWAVPGRWGAAVARGGIAAPAVGIPGADPTGGYTVRSGSSFAAAFVAAAFALLRSLRPDLAREALWWALLDPRDPGRALGRIPTLDADRGLERLAAIYA